MPFAGTPASADLVNVAASFNLPLRLFRVPHAGTATISSTPSVDRLALLEVSGTAVVETVKLAEDRPALLVRVYEAFGGRASTIIAAPPYVSFLGGAAARAGDGERLGVRPPVRAP